MIAGTGLAAVAGLDEGQQAAARVARFHVRVNRHEELMLWGLRAHAVDRFVVHRVCLPAHGVTDARLRQQIAFIGRINEHPGAIHLAVPHYDFRDARTGLLH